MHLKHTMEKLTLQQAVAQFCNENSLALSLENQVLDLALEVGELAKEVLKASNYGAQQVSVTSAMQQELGDVLYSVLVIANWLGIEAHDLVQNTLDKYQMRIRNGSGPQSTR